MTEAELLDAIIIKAGQLGVVALHIPDRAVRLMGPAWKGWPDLTLIGYHGHMFREVKGDGYAGKLTTGQRVFGYRLTAAGGDFGTWDPRNWRSGRIERELEAIR